MEIFFAYSRILRRKSQKSQQKDSAQVGPGPRPEQPAPVRRKASLLERLRLASAWQNTDQ